MNIHHDMKNLRKILLSIAIVVLAGCNLLAQSQKAKEIDTLMRSSHQLGIFNGNVLIAEKGKTVYRSEFGYADAAKKTKLTSSYRFSIGSIQKEFSAVSIMMLQEQGKVRLTDKVSAYISDLPTWSEKVSIKDLLEYTSGLPEVNWDTIKNPKDVYADLKKIDSLPFEPGTKFLYSNNNVMLRQFIVEKITGLAFNRYVERFIYKPCQMNSSVLNPSSETRDIAKSFNDDLRQDPTDSPLTGDAYVTADDLYKWTQCLYAGKIINEKSISTLGRSFNPSNGGLGKTVFENDKLVLHQHDGQSRNYEALVFSDLKEHVTIILIGNNKQFKVFEIADAVKSILKGNPYKQPKKFLSKYLYKPLVELKIDDFISLYNDLKHTRSSEFDFESERNLNFMGYYLLNENRVDDAIKLFALNCQLFPESGNAFDSLGEAYLRKGDKNQALVNYKKSLALDPTNAGAKKVIEELERPK